jgi:hypothetical protein
MSAIGDLAPPCSIVADRQVLSDPASSQGMTARQPVARNGIGQRSREIQAHSYARVAEVLAARQAWEQRRNASAAAALEVHALQRRRAVDCEQVRLERQQAQRRPSGRAAARASRPRRELPLYVSRERTSLRPSSATNLWRADG